MKEKTEKRKIRYGIVGFGKQGSLYGLKFKLKIDKNAELTAICDINPERRKFAEKHFKRVPVFEKYLDMFRSGLCDVIMVETPHYLHVPIAMAALNNNLNVLVDKPISVETTEAYKLISKASTRKDLVFGMMFNQRTNRHYVKAKQIIENGDLGEVTRIVWIITNWYRPQAYYNQGGWRGTWAGEGGGVLLNQCPHQLDLFTWFGGPLKKVWAKADTIGRKINVENDVTINCEFQNGAKGVFITSTHDAPGTNRLEITGTGGKIVIEGRKFKFIQNAQLEPEFSAINKKFMGKPKTKKHFDLKTITEWLIEMIFVGQHFRIVKNYSDFLLGNTDKLIAQGQEGMNGLILSNAAHLSAWLGREIDVPFDPNIFMRELKKKVAQEKAQGRVDTDYFSRIFGDTVDVESPTSESALEEIANLKLHEYNSATIESDDNDVLDDLV